MLEDEKRTFFCSELVAAVYKYINILPTNVSSKKYWPGNAKSKLKNNLKINLGDFSYENNIKFLEGASLGKE